MRKAKKTKKGRIRIVIADDNVNMREGLRDILTENGYAVDTVNNGYELLAYLKGRSAHLVILDLMMPEKDGLSILGTVKAVRPGIKIIIYTGFQQYKNSLYAKKVDRFLLKEQGPRKLLQSIKSLS